MVRFLFKRNEKYTHQIKSESENMLFPFLEKMLDERDKNLIVIGFRKGFLRLVVRFDYLENACNRIRTL